MVAGAHNTGQRLTFCSISRFHPILLGAVNSKSGETHTSAPLLYARCIFDNMLTLALPAGKATNRHGCCPQRGNIWESMRCPGRRPTSGSPRYAAPRTSCPWRTPYWRVVHRHLFRLQQAPQSNNMFPSGSPIDVSTTSSVPIPARPSTPSWRTFSAASGRLPI